MKSESARRLLFAGVLTLSGAGGAFAQYQVFDDEQPGIEAATEIEIEDGDSLDEDAAEPDLDVEEGGAAAFDDEAPDAGELDAEAIEAEGIEAEAEHAVAALCREPVDAFMADKAILFGSGSARLTDASGDVVAGLAEILAACPGESVYVEGHTDSDGGAEANLVLSLTRAEAVVDALIELGIAPDRLYAVGYGASLPIASNDTAAGKAENRRIVFSFEDIAEASEEES